MNLLDNKRRAQVIAALVEGNSIRATVRMTGVAKKTVMKLLVDLGEACADYQDGAFRNLNCTRIECDEIWSFVGAKAKNATQEQKEALSGATSGRGLRLMPTRNLFLAGWSGRETRMQHTSLFKTWHHDSRIGFSLRPMDTRHISKRSKLISALKSTSHSSSKFTERQARRKRHDIHLRRSLERKRSGSRGIP